MQLDKLTNRLATPACPDDYTIAFIAGTEPHDTCDQPSGVQGFFSRIFHGTPERALPPATTNGPPANGNSEAANGVQTDEEGKKKKGFFGKIADVFKGDGNKGDKNTPQSSKPPGNSATPP